MKKFLFVWAVLLGASLLGCSLEPAHQHTFGEWTLKEQATCAKAGYEERICADCQAIETRPTEKPAHDLNAYNICKNCRYVDFDPEATVAELGIFSNYYYTNDPTANYAWDVKIWGDFVYRGAGDYDKNAGTTPILAFNKATQSWAQMGMTDDQSLQRFVEIDGKLYAPGIDANGEWDLGNFYVLEGNTWTQVRNLPNGLHNFDMVEFDGKIFAGLGTQTPGNTVAVSADKGETWAFVPLYQNGKIFDTGAYEYSRTYAFAKYDNSLYALLMFKKANGYDYCIFRYAEGKMEYQSQAGNLTSHVSWNYWQSVVEWKGVCYLTSSVLNAITDFSDPDSHRQIPMPNEGVVSDILLYNDELYVLSFAYDQQTQSCAVTIYKSLLLLLLFIFVFIHFLKKVTYSSVQSLVHSFISFNESIQCTCHVYRCI